MRNRLWQVAAIAGVGVVLGLVIGRDWSDDDPVPPPAKSVAQAPASPPPVPEPAMEPSTRPFDPQTIVLRSDDGKPQLSVIRSAQFRSTSGTPVVKFVSEPPERPPPSTQLVPKDWLLRGTGPQNYEVRTERVEVFSGNSSVLMKAHERADIPPGLTASLMQSVSADPWVGKRVQFTVRLRPWDRMQDGGMPLFEVWFRVTDAGHAVIEYKAKEGLPQRHEWQPVTVIADVPWSAAEMAYGVSVRGKGGLWVDDVKIDSLDRSVPATGRQMPNMLGVVAQAASDNGPLPQPSNLDFEATVELKNTDFREPPPDQMGRRRF